MPLMHYGADVPSSISYPSQVREWQPDGSERQFAVKRIIVDRNDSEHVEITQREIGTMRSLPPHPNIVELIGICKRQSGSSRTSVEEVFLLLELCKSGSLAEILMQRAEQKAPLTPSEAAKALYDMALALCHMHAQTPPLAHRDVKPENYILGDTDGRLRLCDFGSATPRVFAHEPSTKSHEVAREEEEIHRTSTPQYRAPEMCDLRRGEPVGVAADVWALGVSLYKLLFLQDLFGTPGEERLGILNFDPSKRLSPAALSSLGATPGTAGANELLLELLRMCLTPSTTARPPVASVLQWLSSRSSRTMAARRTPRRVGRGSTLQVCLALASFRNRPLPKGHGIRRRGCIRSSHAAEYACSVRCGERSMCRGQTRSFSCRPTGCRWSRFPFGLTTRTAHDFLAVLSSSRTSLRTRPVPHLRQQGGHTRYRGVQSALESQEHLLLLSNGYPTLPPPRPLRPPRWFLSRPFVINQRHGRHRPPVTQRDTRKEHSGPRTALKSSYNLMTGSTRNHRPPSRQRCPTSRCRPPARPPVPAPFGVLRRLRLRPGNSNRPYQREPSLQHLLPPPASMP